MPPPASKRRTSSRSFDRIEGESPRAYEAFCLYRNMGPDRTLEAVRTSAGYSSPRLLFRWSSEWNWGERSKAFDDHVEARAREIAESYLPEWEARRQASLEAMWLLSTRLMDRAESMLTHPITKEVTRESEDGRTKYVIVEPANWTWSGLATVVRTAAELQAATIAEGLLLSDEAAFDVESATADELREFLRRAKARRGTRGTAI
jgi:hypothetical protein